MLYDEILEGLKLAGMSEEEHDKYAYEHSEPVDEYIQLEEDYASNAPCDFSGYCAGISCPYWGACQGG